MGAAVAVVICRASMSDSGSVSSPDHSLNGQPKPIVSMTNGHFVACLSVRLSVRLFACLLEMFAVANPWTQQNGAS